MRILQIALLVLPLALKIIRLFVETPADKRQELISQLDQATKKAIDEKDPSELSRIVNG